MSKEHRPLTRRWDRLFVWLGGGLFAGALALCAYAYLVSWSDPAAGAPHAIPGARGWSGLAVDVGLFGLFAAHHSLFARETVKVRLARVVPPRLLRSVYVWTASILLILVCLCWQPIGRNLYTVSGPQRFAHAALQLAGLWIIAASVAVIDGLELAGIRGPSDPGGAPPSLQERGPYRCVRHPLYLGWMLATLGAAHMTADRLAFAAISSIYLLTAMPWEERSLERAFPGGYRRYSRRVRWRLIPYIY
jgi:methanethiol S-methyltransferase